MQRLTPENYEDFCRDFNVEVPENYNFAYDVMDRLASEKPDTPAMVHVEDDRTSHTYDFAFFKEASDRLASAMLQQGLVKGDRVMLILYRRIEFWITMLALHKIGVVAVPSPALLTPHDIEFRAQYASLAGAIVEDSVADRIDAVKDNCPSFRVLVQVDSKPDAKLHPGWLRYSQIVADAPAFQAPEPRPGGKDIMQIFFSSGTTGMPKMVEHTHEYPLGHLATAVYWHDLKPGDLHLTVADTGWGKTSWGKLYGQWIAEATIFVWDFRGKFDPVHLLEVISEHRVTSFCAPPTVYRFLIRQDVASYDLSALRHCTTAGELLNAGVFEAWKKITGHKIYEGYGQTETCLQIATFPFMEPKPGSIGKPTPGWDVHLMDDNGEFCAAGQEGEICVRVDQHRPLGLFDSYLLEPEKTAAVIHDGWYHTGDKAWMDEDGYYWFLGRTDDLIKSSGYRVGPFEVESVLITHPAIVEAAVTGIPDPVRGQAIKATVTLAPGFEPSEELTKEIQTFVKKETAPYKYPRVIDYVDELPKTISGKIKRAEIREKDNA